MKKNLLWLLIPVVLLVIWAPINAQAVQMLTNSDFESWDQNGRNGPPDDWTLAVSEIQAVREAFIVHGGNYSAKVLYDSTGTLQFNHIPVPVVAGTPYACSLWVYDDYSAPGNARMRPWFFFSPNGSGGPSTYSIDSAGWKLYTFQMDAPTAPLPATSLVVQLRFYGGAVGRWDSIYVDDVTLWGQIPSGNTPPAVGPTVRIPAGTVYADTPVVVKSTIMDLDGTVVNDSMYLQINGGAFVAYARDSVSTGSPNDNWWHIVGHTSGTVVNYYVEATDEDGGRSQSQTFTYTVVNPTPTHVPIYSIEHTTNQGTLPSCFISDSLNLTEQITGIVVGRYEGGGATGHKRLFLQDATTPWSGVSVYNSPDTAQVGDSITVAGLVTEYYGETEITPVSTMIKYGPGTSPAAQVITCATLGLDSCSVTAEPYEGMLIQINNITLIDTLLPPDVGEYRGVDGSGDTCVVSNDLTTGGADPATFILGHTYDYIRGIGRYTYGHYRIMPRVAADVYTAPLVCTGGYIYNIEFNNSNPGADTADCYPSPNAGQIATVCGIVTAVRQNLYPSYYLQDQNNTSYGAIYGYDYTLPNGDPIAAHLGDYVQVTATINEYYGWTELDTVTSYTVLGTNQPLPVITDLNVAAFTQLGICNFTNEAYESELIRLQNVTIRSAAPALDGKYWITDNSSTDSIRIDDDLWVGGPSIPNPLPGTGAVYTSLIGVIRYEGRQGAGNVRGWILMPRFASDFEIGTIPPPSVVNTWTIDNTHMAVTFDRAMNTTSIGTPGNYSTVHGLSITGAEAAPGNNRKAILTTATQPNNTIDSLVISGVCDSLGGCLPAPVYKLYHSGITSIFVIQLPNARGDSSMYVGQLFTTKGVLTSDSLHGHYSNYFLRDEINPPYNAIHLYIGGINPLPFLGDTVIVTGLCMEYNLETELSDLSVYQNCQILSTAGADPTPDQATLAELKAHGEYYESDLVTVCDSFQVVNTAFDAKGWLVTTYAAPPESLIVYKDARWTDDYTYVPVVGDKIKGITGIFRFAWNYFRISPRTNADFNSSATWCAAPTGTIAGIAYNADDITPLPNVHVITHDAAQVVVDDQISSALGTWNVALPPGTYHEHLSKSGFQDTVINNIVVTSGNTTNVNANMQLIGGCVYVVGDANGNGSFTGLDVTYSVRWFKGGSHPPYSCLCGATVWYVAGDVNGSCSFTGLDVTMMVRHFKSNAPVNPCPTCPPPPPDILGKPSVKLQNSGSIGGNGAGL